MKKPLVSIILPCYNDSKYLPFCLKSILNQDFEDFEIVFIDDASTDNSLEIAKEFAKEDKRIKIFKNKKNMGCYQTDNRSFKLTKGRYITHTSADDGMLQGNLRKKVEILENNPEVSFVFSEMRRIDGKGNKLFDTTYRNKGSYINRDDFQDIIEWGNFISPGTLIIRKEVFGEIGLWDERFPIMMEWFMTLKLCKNFKSTFINEPLVYFRFHEKNFNPQRFDPFEKEKEVITIIEEGEFNRNERKLLLGNMHYGSFIVFHQKKEFVNSIIYLMKSLMYNPKCFFLHLKYKKMENAKIWNKFRKELNYKRYRK